MPAQAANITKVAYFEDGETLPPQYYLLDAQLEHLKSCSQGTFLLPSFLPKADYLQYAVALDEHTGIHHVARKGGRAIKKSSAHSSSKQQQRHFNLTSGKPSGVSEQTVSMPVAFEGIMKKFEPNTTRLGYFQDEQSLSSDDNSVSVFESIKAAMGLMPSTGITSQDKTTELSLPSINTIDESIIEIGRPVQQPNALLSALQPSTECSTLISETNDAAFFKSLLSNQDDAQAVVPKDLTQEKAHQSTDKMFFESLLSQQEPVRDKCSALALAPMSNIKLPSERFVTLAPKHKFLDPLDLAMHESITSPPSAFQELDLAVTIDQASVLLDDGDDFLLGKGAGEPVGIPWTNESVHFATPFAPVEDALSYKDYFPSRSPSSTDSSTGMTTSCGSPALDGSQTSMDTAVTPKAKDDLALVLKHKPLEENEWLDLAQAFHNRPEVTDGDISKVRSSSETLQKSSTCSTLVNLPWNDSRQTCESRIGEDSTHVPLASSVEAFTPGSEHDEPLPRVQLPVAASNAPMSASEQQPETQNDDVRAAIQALDIAAVFGGNANDWSDDADLSTPESSAAAALEFTSNHSCHEHDRRDNSDSAILALNEVDSYTPLHTCRRLPAPVFKAINNDYKTLRDVYPPSNKDENDELYEQALANVKPVFDDIPDDILHWLHEVNVEFVRTCSDRSGGGAFWDHDLPCEEMWNLAVSNVEWRYFGHVMSNSEHTELDRPAFEHARSPKACLMDLLGCDEHPQSMAEEAPKEEEEDDDDRSTAFHHSGPKLHHTNFNGDCIYDRSCTPPAVSYWAIQIAKYGRNCDTSPYIKGLPAVHVKKVLTSQAFKYVDPVCRLSNNANAPADADGHELIGSRLQDAVTGEVYIIYQPYGSWLEDEYTADDDVPTQAVEGDETHQVSMTECPFLRRPYHMNPRDDQHDLLHFNGESHLNPSVVSTLPRRHNGDSPLMQVSCLGDVTPELAVEDDVALYQSSPHIVHSSPSRSIESNESCSTATTADDENESTSSSPAPIDPTASAEYQAAEASIMETAWDSWDLLETDSEPDDAEEDVGGWEPCTTVVATVTPDHMLPLPDSMDDDLEDNEAMGETISEASTEIEDLETLQNHQPTEYIDSRLNTKQTRLVLRGGDFHSSYNGIGSWISEPQASNLPPHKLNTIVTPLSSSNLRPHRFFTVDTPDTIAPTMALFPAQDSLQNAIDHIVDAVPPSPADSSSSSSAWENCPKTSDDSDIVMKDSSTSAPQDSEMGTPPSYLPRLKSMACQCRIPSTPAEAFPRGSIADSVVGVVYIAFLFGKWMCGM